MTGKAVFEVVSIACAALLALVTQLAKTHFTRRQRQRYPILRRLDGKQIEIVVLVIILIAFGATSQYLNTRHIEGEQLELRMTPADDGFLTGRSAVFESELVNMDTRSRELATEPYIDAERSVEAGRYSYAEEKYRASIKASPTVTAYLSLGACQAAETKYKDAEASFNLGLALQSTISTPHLLPELQSNLAVVLRKEGRLDEAEGFALKAADVSLRSERRVTRALAVTTLGNIEADRGKYDAARDEYDTALSIYRSFGDHIGLGMVLTDLSRVASDSGKINPALDLASKALAEFSGVHNAFGESEAYLSLGNAYAASGQSSKSLDAYQEANRLAISINNPLLAASASVNIADELRLSGNYQNALVLAKAAIHDAAQLDVPDMEGIAHVTTGNIYAYQNHVVEALSEFEAAARSFSLSGDELNYANALGNSAEMQRITGNLVASEAASKSALDTFVRIGNLEGAANSYVGLGNSEFTQHNFPASLSYYRKALATANQGQDERHIAMAHASIGNVYLQLNQFENAERELDAALKEYSIVSDALNEVGTQEIIGLLDIKRRRFCEAKAVLSEAKEKSLKLGNSDLISAIQSDLVKAQRNCP